MNSWKTTTAVILLILGIGPLISAESREITGVVFEDLDGNAVLDHGEPGIDGVRISDQVSIVTSGPDGSFALESDGGYGVVYVAQPTGYRVSGEFWQRIPSNDEALRFPMIKVDDPSGFTFIHASDPHLSPETLPRMRRLREIVGEQRPAFVIITGDLIRDALRVSEDEATGLYELLLQELAEFSVPVWNALGNHEIFGIERHHSLVSPEHPMYGKTMYRHYLGPNYYSFDFGGIRFIGLDTVDYDDLWYYGHVDQVQMNWLEADLESMTPGTPVVTFGHIPLLSSGENLYGYQEDGPAPTLLTVDGETGFRHSVRNTAAVLTRLRHHDYTLALSGHFHMREKLFYESSGVQTRFYMSPAVRNDTLDQAGLDLISGVVLYKVDNGKIDDGTFIRLDPSN